MSIYYYLEYISNLLWDKYLMILLIGVGIYYTFATKFVQIRYLKKSLKYLIDSMKKKEENEDGTITSFQALTNALASCVGNGNLVGVATAVASGGPGALFWMWIMGFIGMATKYAEIVLGIIYREKDEKGNYVGGPMYYISKGLGLKFLAILFSILMFLQILGGGLIQSNAVSELINKTFYIPRIYVSIFLVLIIYIVIAGGLKRLSKVTEKLVPIMLLFYLFGAIIVIIFNYSHILDAIKNIFYSAFSYNSALGGALGYSIKTAMRYGIARGLYSNEAGEGSAPVLHSSANVKKAHDQGLMGIVEVFIDIIVCSISGLVVVMSEFYLTDLSPVVHILKAFEGVNYNMRYIVFTTIILFSYSTIISQWYFGNVTLNYMFKNNIGKYFKYLFILIIFTGTLLPISHVWLIQDIILGVMIIPNIFALIFLRKDVLNELKRG